MKKARYNYSTTTTTATVTTRTLENTHGAEKLSAVPALPNPPSEETVARLNAIAREYPFCAYMKQNNLFLL
jgi:hypothetical protein